MVTLVAPFHAPRTAECSGPPVRSQAVRLDAESLDIVGACPRCPTCPVKIIKSEERDSELPKFIKWGRRSHRAVD